MKSIQLILENVRLEGVEIDLWHNYVYIPTVACLDRTPSFYPRNFIVEGLSLTTKNTMHLKKIFDSLQLLDIREKEEDMFTQLWYNPSIIRVESRFK